MYVSCRGKRKISCNWLLSCATIVSWRRTHRQLERLFLADHQMAMKKTLRSEVCKRTRSRSHLRSLPRSQLGSPLSCPLTPEPCSQLAVSRENWKKEILPLRDSYLHFTETVACVSTHTPAARLSALFSAQLAAHTNAYEYVSGRQHTWIQKPEKKSREKKCERVCQGQNQKGAASFGASLSEACSKLKPVSKPLNQPRHAVPPIEDGKNGK